MWLCCAKTDGWIEVLFGVETLGNPWHIVLYGGSCGERGFEAAFAKLLLFLAHRHITAQIYV